jgi:hypothetical protein
MWPFGVCARAKQVWRGGGGHEAGNGIQMRHTNAHTRARYGRRWWWWCAGERAGGTGEEGVECRVVAAVGCSATASLIPSHLIPNPPSRKPLLLLKSVLAATFGPRCFCPTKTLSRAKHYNNFFTTPHNSSLPSFDNPPARPRSTRYTALASMRYRARRARSQQVRSQHSLTPPAPSER